LRILEIICNKYSNPKIQKIKDSDSLQQNPKASITQDLSNTSSTT